MLRLGLYVHLRVEGEGPSTSPPRRSYRCGQAGDDVSGISLGRVFRTQRIEIMPERGPRTRPVKQLAKRQSVGRAIDNRLSGCQTASTSFSDLTSELVTQCRSPTAELRRRQFSNVDLRAHFAIHLNRC